MTDERFDNPERVLASLGYEVALYPAEDVFDPFATPLPRSETLDAIASMGEHEWLRRLGQFQAYFAGLPADSPDAPIQRLAMAWDDRAGNSHAAVLELRRPEGRPLPHDADPSAVAVRQALLRRAGKPAPPPPESHPNYIQRSEPWWT